MAEIVAVDGGASSCRLAVFSDSGCELARVSMHNHASLSMGVDSAWQHIKRGLGMLRQQLNADESWRPEHLVMGLAGSLQQQRRDEFLNRIPMHYSRTLVTDGYAQLLGATRGEPGICLSVGTGSVLHWLDESGQTGMAGGWGFPVGDQGSGAWLGLRALQHYIDFMDGGTVESSLTDALRNIVGTDVSDIQKWTTESCASVLARLAPLIFEHALKGDDLARQLLDEAVVECLQLIKLAPAQLPVFVAGGIGLQLQHKLAIALPERIRNAQFDALYGLWLISRKCQ